jgi:hypothetical protein
MANSTTLKWVDSWYEAIAIHLTAQHPQLTPGQVNALVQEEMLQILYGGLAKAPPDLPPTVRSQFPISAIGLGQIYERLLSYNPALKKSGGSYYTPLPLVEFVIQNTVRVESPELRLPRVLDPACGGGIFLVLAYQALLTQRSQQLGRPLIYPEREEILLNSIYGVDIDPQAVLVTQNSLFLLLLEHHPTAIPPDLSKNIQCGNSVIQFDWKRSFPHVFQDLDANDSELNQPGFDIVIGNPPYLDSEGMTAYVPKWRRYCNQHYRCATGNWDLFCIFIEKGLALCRTGGLLSLVVPNKLAAADYATGTRSLLATDSQMVLIKDYSHDRSVAFGAAVYPLVFVTQKSVTQKSRSVLPSRRESPDALANSGEPWLIGASPQQTLLLRRLQTEFPKLAEVAEVSGAATVAEAYSIKALIREGNGETSELRMINSGTLDRYCFLWGQKPMRYLGQSYQRPVVRESDRLPPKRLQQSRQPKIIVSGMTRRLECGLDAHGSILAAKSTLIIQPAANSPNLPLEYLLGLLNSRLISFYFTHYFGGNRLQGRYLRVGSSQLRQIPVPIPTAAQQEHMIQLVSQRMAKEESPHPSSMDSQIDSQIDSEIDRLVYQLYHLTPTEIEIMEQVLL